MLLRRRPLRLILRALGRPLPILLPPHHARAHHIRQINRYRRAQTLHHDFGVDGRVGGFAYGGPDCVGGGEEGWGDGDEECG